MNNILKTSFIEWTEKKILTNNNDLFKQQQVVTATQSQNSDSNND